MRTSTKSVVALLLAMGMSICLLAGCGSKPKANDLTAGEAHPDPDNGHGESTGE